MKLLVTADLHGHIQAYEQFARSLSRPEYAAGVIAGDLMTHLTLNEAGTLLDQAGISPDDDLPELPGADDLRPSTPGYHTGAPGTGAEAAQSPSARRRSKIDEVFAEGIRERAGEFQDLLGTAQKPVLIVMGNDDGIVAGGIELSSTDLVWNINQRKVTIGDWFFVGYQYTTPLVGGLFEKPEHHQRIDLDGLRPLVDTSTVLITHGPPWRVLDRAHGSNYGSRALRRFVRRTHPWLHLFGHIHQSAGWRGRSVNVAYPLKRKFVEVDVDRRLVSWVEPEPR